MYVILFRCSSAKRLGHREKAFHDEAIVVERKSKREVSVGIIEVNSTGENVYGSKICIRKRFLANVCERSGFKGISCLQIYVTVFNVTNGHYGHYGHYIILMSYLSLLIVLIIII